MRLLLALLLVAAPHAGGKLHWVASWVGSAQGPFPTGNAVAQPDLKLVFPEPARGARDQSFRLIVKPALWGCSARIRLSNVFGTTPVTFDGVHLGVQQSGSSVVAGTNRPVGFAGAASVTVAPGASAWSDAVPLPFACGPAAAVAGRKLAVSFHVAGESGPMTWHAKALQTSYVTAPGAGSKGAGEGEAGFPFSTTSWYFLDAVEMAGPPDARAVVAFGDSITDGTNSTLNGDDRWPDVLGRRLQALHGKHVAVVNAGIGGNRVVGPAEYSPSHPFSGGPSALARLERDVLSLSAVSAVIWLEGINDFNKTNDASPEAVAAGMKEGVARLRARLPGVRVIGATVTSALGASNGSSGTAEQDARRKALNEIIRHAGLFDAVADFDQATLDPATGRLKPAFVPNTTIGGPGDNLHPNRLGLAAMAAAVDLGTLEPAPRPRASASR
jgi:lysophospholipase L1-like esterase